MSAWKNRFVVLTMIVLGASFLLFFITGYIALYWAWARANLAAARLYLPWARNSGMLAISVAALALVILFSSKAFPVLPKVRLWLSLLATITIGFFAEFRNEGKFYFKNLHDFFGPGTLIHDGLHRIVPSVGDFLYRLEYSHWNDFLMGPAIVSVLFVPASVRIFRTFHDQGALHLIAPTKDASPDLDSALRFARIAMNVGLFWFFCMAWAEKAGYISNPHSGDEIDLPFEFGGTMVGFWMARVLTKPFDQRFEDFRSTFLIDFLSSGVIGLLYTLIVSPLTEGVAWAVGHALYPVVPNSLDAYEYTSFQRHTRPIELLLLAGATWWSLNQPSISAEITRLGDGVREEPDVDPKWSMLKTMATVLAWTAGYLAILAAMFSLLEPQGLVWTLTTAGTGLGAGAGAFLLVEKFGQQGITKLLSKNNNALGKEQ